VADDDGQAARMDAALARAVAALGVSVDGEPAHRSWRGQRWGVPVSRGTTPGWLKLSEQARALGIPGLWSGPATAHDTLPPAVVRPALLDTVDWNSGDHYYRAELWHRLGPRCTTSGTTFLRAAPELDEAWWSRLRASLDALRTVSTTRRAIRQRYLDVAMRRQLPFVVGTTVGRWSAAHADLHWANVTTPEFALVDWERWGLAPAGWDIAMLHVFSLLVPGVAAEIRRRFAAEFADPATVLAELGVIAWLLDTRTDEDIDALAAAARLRAAELGAMMAR
jgi:hypothetical protein